MKKAKFAIFVTLLLACLTLSAIAIYPIRASQQKLIKPNPIGNTLIDLESGIGIAALAVFVLTVILAYSYERSPHNKKRTRNIIRILFAVLPLALGYVFAYASGVSYASPIESHLNSYGFPLTWLNTEMSFSQPSSVNFATFTLDFLFFSGIFAVAFWLLYYEVIKFYR